MLQGYQTLCRRLIFCSQVVRFIIFSVLVPKDRKGVKKSLEKTLTTATFWSLIFFLTGHFASYRRLRDTISNGFVLFSSSPICFKFLVMTVA